VEFTEKLRLRDHKINMLIAKQREVWKYLTKLEHTMIKHHHTFPNEPLPGPVLHSHSANDEENEKVNDFEDNSFYMLSENDASSNNAALSDSFTDKDSNLSTLRSEDATREPKPESKFAPNVKESERKMSMKEEIKVMDLDKSSDIEESEDTPEKTGEISVVYPELNPD
jgi:hypothetical protein